MGPKDPEGGYENLDYVWHLGYNFQMGGAHIECFAYSLTMLC